MKKLLFSLILAGISATTINAQTVWDFSTWTGGTDGVVAAGYGSNTLVKNIAFIPGTGTADLGAVENNNATFVEAGVTPDYKPTKRLKLNGASYVTSGANYGVPTKRFFYVKVDGPSTIKVWYKNGGSGNRTLYLSDGANVLASNVYANSTDGIIYTYEYTGAAGNIYFAGDQALNFYKVTATNVGTTELPATLAVNDIKSGLKANAFSSANKIYVSNLDSKNTTINVYSANGSLVKTMKASADTNFEINAKGLYIVNLKSEAGEKSVKVLLK